MYLTTSGNTIRVDHTPLASGGEGQVFSMTNRKDKVCKIYHPKNRTQHRYDKLSYMIQNPPLKGADPRLQKSVIWPEDVLLDPSGNFVGYLMSKVSSGAELGYFTVFMRHPKVKSSNWDKLCYHEGAEFFLRRMIVCYNLCKAIALIHSKKEYQICDLKPSNILIDPTGFVSVIDLDSIQINSSQERFLSALYTPEYSSPEFIQNRDPNRSVCYDRFSLAVILYQLLTGVHPFQGILKAKQDGTLTDNIVEGAFARGQRSTLLSGIPETHQIFDYLPVEIQLAFTKTFDLGHTNPKQRFSALEWEKVLKIILSRNKAKLHKPVSTSSHKKSINKPFNQKKPAQKSGTLKHNHIVKKYQTPKKVITTINKISLPLINKLQTRPTPLKSEINGLDY